MKRAHSLLPKIAEMDNMRLAFWKASHKKSGKKEILEYQQNLEFNLLMMRRQILEGSIEVGDYHYFKIYDPKERLICAASFPERVLHHAIINICEPVFEKFQIYDSYATRKRKGTHAALERAFIFQKKNNVFLKLDVRKYFDSIDHEILLKILYRKFKDTYLLRLFEQIIQSYETEPGKGLPIGNLTSQFFANFYFAGFDHFVKENLRIKYYVRYMDDMVLWCDDKKKIKEYYAKIKEYIYDLKLSLNPEVLNFTEKGLPFLGYRLFKNQIRLNKRSKQRFIKKMNLYQQYLEQQVWSQECYQSHILPLLDFIQTAETMNLRKQVLKGIDRWALTA